MKIQYFLFALPLIQVAQGQGTSVGSPISMEQLMQSLRVKGGNWTFSFASPVFARIKCDLSSYPGGKETTTTAFISDKASTTIDLFFMDSPQELGEMRSFKSLNERVVKIKLSDCEETKGTRLVHYNEKFSTAPWNKEKGQISHFSPAIAKAPELNKEYVLTHYFRTGDPYEAKVTICFVEKVEDLAKVPPFDARVARGFKITGE
jgi:hypothetical protein